MFYMISDGTIKLDAGILFGNIPRVMWESQVVVDRKHRITLGLNCLVIINEVGVALVNTGVGSFVRNEKFTDDYGLAPSRLMKGLRFLNVGPKDVKIVILSDLRFYHAGGCLRLNRAGKVVSMFPQARYYIQKDAVEEAMSDNSLTARWYPIDVISPLVERQKVYVLDGDAEIWPGINVVKTGGPSQGHQVVIAVSGGERILHPGGLIPTIHHLSPACVPSSNIDREKSLSERAWFIDMALHDGHLMIFEHEVDHPAGYLERSRDGDVRVRLHDLRPSERINSPYLMR